MERIEGESITITVKMEDVKEHNIKTLENIGDMVKTGRLATIEDGQERELNDFEKEIAKMQYGLIEQ